MPADFTVTFVDSPPQRPYERAKYVVECDHCDWVHRSLERPLARQAGRRHVNLHPKHDWTHGSPVQKLTERGHSRIVIASLSILWVICLLVLFLPCLIVAGVAWLFSSPKHN